MWTYLTSGHRTAQERSGLPKKGPDGPKKGKRADLKEKCGGLLVTRPELVGNRALSRPTRRRKCRGNKTKTYQEVQLPCSYTHSYKAWPMLTLSRCPDAVRAGPQLPPPRLSKERRFRIITSFTSSSLRRRSRRLSGPLYLWRVWAGLMVPWSHLRRAPPSMGPPLQAFPPPLLAASAPWPFRRG